MFSWLKTLFAPASPAGPPHLLKVFKRAEDPLKRGGELVSPGEWCFRDRPSGFEPLFQIEPPEVDRCLVTFRAELRSEQPLHEVSLELLARLPSRSPRVSRTPGQTLDAQDGWRFFEVTVHLKRDQQPSLLRLGVATVDPGTLWIRNVKVLVTPAA